MQECNTIVFGADVHHTASGSQDSSVAAVVASLDDWCSQYAHETREQPSREEKLLDLEEMVYRLLLRWIQHNQREVQRISRRASSVAARERPRERAPPLSRRSLPIPFHERVRLSRRGARILASQPRLVHLQLEGQDDASGPRGARRSPNVSGSPSMRRPTGGGGVLRAVFVASKEVGLSDLICFRAIQGWAREGRVKLPDRQDRNHRSSGDLASFLPPGVSALARRAPLV